MRGVEDEDELDFFRFRIDGELKVAKVAGVGFFIVERDGALGEFVFKEEGGPVDG